MATNIVQFTDLHLRPPGQLACGSVDTAVCLRAAVASMQALPFAIDAVVITGDLADAGWPAEYEQLRALLAPLPCPVYLLAGNHDDPRALRQAFPEQPGDPGDPDFRYSVPVGPLQLIALDTTVAGQPHGALDAQRLRWLADALHACGDRPVLLAMHHPPFATGIAHMDAMGLLQGAAALEAVVRANPHVQRLICGHVHRSVQVRFGGSIASICPSTAHQVALELHGDARAAWTREPSGFQLHVWDAGGRLVTHEACIGRFPGPFTFDD